MDNVWVTTEDGFKKVEVVERSEGIVCVKDDQGTEDYLPIGSPSKDGFYPAFFEKEPASFWKIHGRTVIKPEKFVDPEQAGALIPQKEPYVFLPHALKVIDGIIGKWDPRDQRYIPDAQFLVGPKGCGKTSLVNQIAARVGQPVVRVNITSQMLGDVLFGQMTLIKGETRWIDGPVTLAARMGYWLLLDEFDFLNPEVSSYFYPLLETKPFLYLKDKPGGEAVPIHPNFRVFASGNCMGKEDAKYVGTQPINAAILDRFSSGQIIPIEPMSAQQEIIVVKKNRPHVSDNIIKRAVRTAEMIRGNQRGPYPELSTRQVINWIDKMLLTRRTKEAAERTWLPLVDDASKEAAIMIIEKYGGQYVRPLVGKGLMRQGAETPKAGNAETAETPKAPIQVAEDAEMDFEGRTSAQVTDPEEMRVIWQARQRGLSHGQIEKLYNLRDNNGMNAYRIEKAYSKQYSED